MAFRELARTWDVARWAAGPGTELVEKGGVLRREMMREGLLVLTDGGIRMVESGRVGALVSGIGRDNGLVGVSGSIFCGDIVW